MTKAIIFDCFGVLTADLWLQFKEKYLTNPELNKQASDLSKQADRGMMSYNDFRHRIAELAGVSVSKANFLPGSTAANELLFEYIEDKLKPPYKIGILSNASENFLNTLFSQKQTQLFDDVVLSCEVDLYKPQPQIYELAACKLSVKPEECIFVDDREVYCEAAREVGMQAICYQSFSQFKIELEPLLSHV